MKNLIVTADDYGVFPSINQGVKDAIKNGKVNSVACISNYKDSVKNVKELMNGFGDKIEIGCHLTISSGEALTVQNDDAFCYGKVFRPFSNLNINAIEEVPGLLEKELRAQIDIFKDNNIPVTNLSCHHTTLTTTAGLLKIYLKVAAAYKVPIRSVNIMPSGKDNTFRTILNLLLRQHVPKKKLQEMRRFGKEINDYLNNYETKIITPHVLESSHYGPIPQAGFLDAMAPVEVRKKHKHLNKFFKDFSKNDHAHAELMVHLISEDLNLLEEDDGIDYPGIDQNYFDSRMLEYRSLNSFDFAQYPDVKMSWWRELG
ncbi:MAG: ChbG/HpnK family deacetylase [Bacteroidetes bacterium]|nr:ChbG/HpnK family deacetylase [Bacteroidota bacterium]